MIHSMSTSTRDRQKQRTRTSWELKPSHCLTTISLRLSFLDFNSISTLQVSIQLTDVSLILKCILSIKWRKNTIQQETQKDSKAMKIDKKLESLNLAPVSLDSCSRSCLIHILTKSTLCILRLISNGTTDFWTNLFLREMQNYNKVFSTTRITWIWPISSKDLTQIKDGLTQDPSQPLHATKVSSGTSLNPWSQSGKWLWTVSQKCDASNLTKLPTQRSKQTRRWLNLWRSLRRTSHSRRDPKLSIIINSWE